MSRASISIDTGTPGSTPCNVPAEAVPPLIVTDPSLSNWPVQTITPEAGPLYAGGAGGCAGGLGRTGSGRDGGGAGCCGGLATGGVCAGGSGAGGAGAGA